MAAAEQMRQHLRVVAADLHLMKHIPRDELLADLMAACRGAGAPGAREFGDASELAQLWSEIEADSSHTTPLGGAPPG